MGRAESSKTRLEATVAIAALTCCPKHGFDVGPATPAFFRLALTTVAVKSLSPNFPHGPLARHDKLIRGFPITLSGYTRHTTSLTFGVARHNNCCMITCNTLALPANCLHGRSNHNTRWAKSRSRRTRCSGSARRQVYAGISETGHRSTGIQTLPRTMGFGGA